MLQQQLLSLSEQYLFRSIGDMVIIPGSCWDDLADGQHNATRHCQPHAYWQEGEDHVDEECCAPHSTEDAVGFAIHGRQQNNGKHQYQHHPAHPAQVLLVQLEPITHHLVSISKGYMADDTITRTMATVTFL